jgi:Mn-dependent DtxR family transcriptional regulator
MTPDQIAANHRALTNLAAHLEHLGYTGGDAHNQAERIAHALHRDGWRPVEKPPAMRGPTSTPAGRRAARELFEQIRNANEEK